jgi:hypothetical protein
VHGLIDRRTFLNRSARYTAGAAGAAATLAALSPDFARAQQVKPDDARLKTDWIEVASPTRRRVTARSKPMWQFRQMPQSPFRWCWWRMKTAA